MRRLPVVALLSLCATACTPTGSASDGETPAQGAELANVRGQTLSDECPNGGVDIELGIDENADGQLSANEVDRVVTVCNGTDGADGDAGPQGPPGDDGTSCTVVDNGDGTKTITCGDASVTVSDGRAGATCGVVEGSVEIRNSLDVQALAGCTEVTGSLFIQAYDLTSISGLASLTRVGVSLSISGNGALTTLSGLDNLASVGFLEISQNQALTSLSALDSLTSVGEGLLISGNAVLSNLNGLEGVTSVEGDLYIGQNSALTSLSGLEGVTSVGGLSISSNSALTSLSGLGGLTGVEGEIYIWQNSALTSLSGLGGLTSVEGEIYINNNNALPQCEADTLVAQVGRTCGDTAYCGGNNGTGTCQLL